MYMYNTRHLLMLSWRFANHIFPTKMERPHRLSSLPYIRNCSTYRKPCAEERKGWVDVHKSESWPCEKESYSSNVHPYGIRLGHSTDHVHHVRILLNAHHHHNRHRQLPHGLHHRHRPADKANLQLAVHHGDLGRP